MDSISATIKRMQLKSQISQNSSDKEGEEEKVLCPHGTMVGKGWGGRLRIRDCTQCSDEYIKKEKEQSEKYEKINNFERKMRNCTMSVAIPRRFKGKTLDNYEPKTEKQKKVLNVCRKFIENFDSARENGTSIIFCGKPGTGKTHLGYAMVTALWEKYVAALMIPASDMTSEIKYAYKSDTSDVTPSTVTASFTYYDLLVIDEVGVQVDSEAEKRIFFDVINKRYENMFPTILISNLDTQELTKFIGERVMDRMRENGGMVFAFDWDSNR